MACPLYGCKYINTLPLQDFDVGVSIEKARFKTGSHIVVSSTPRHEWDSN
jgi:hypothetical protein